MCVAIYGKSSDTILPKTVRTCFLSFASLPASFFSFIVQAKITNFASLSRPAPRAQRPQRPRARITYGALLTTRIYTDDDGVTKDHPPTSRARALRNYETVSGRYTYPRLSSGAEA